MPTHDRVDVIEYAIQSVLDQTDPDFELLVVGDGCVEGTEQVVCGFGDARVRFFDFPKSPNFGYANRNAALREARGRFVAFAADDDLWFPDHLEQLGAALADGAPLAYSQALWASTDGVLAPVLTNLTFEDEMRFFLGKRNTLCADCVVYRADCLPSLGQWPEDVAEAGDWRLWHKIIRANPDRAVAFRRLPTVIHFSARRKASRSSNFGYLATMLDIADAVDWWPEPLRVAIPDGITEQSVVAELMRADPPGWVAQVRLACTDLTARIAHDYIGHDRSAYKHAERKLAGALQVAEGAAKKHERELREQAERHKRELAGMQFQLDRRRQEVQALRSSSSWRITAPLRSFATAWRQLNQPRRPN